MPLAANDPLATPMFEMCARARAIGGVEEDHTGVDTVVGDDDGFSPIRSRQGVVAAFDLSLVSHVSVLPSSSRHLCRRSAEEKRSFRHVTEITRSV